MNKRISSKQALSVLLTVIIVILGYVVYTAMNEKVSNTFYYVVFETDGGTNIPTTTVKINEKAIKPEEPKKEGYKFKYWALNNMEYNFNAKVRSNITLVAVWEKDNKK